MTKKYMTIVVTPVLNSYIDLRAGVTRSDWENPKVMSLVEAVEMIDKEDWKPVGERIDFRCSNRSAQSYVLDEDEAKLESPLDKLRDRSRHR